MGTRVEPSKGLESSAPLGYNLPEALGCVLRGWARMTHP